MGVSFYSVVEYQQRDTYWSLGRFNISRDYDLFSALAFGDGGVTEGMPHPPRGLPRDCSLETLDLFFTGTEEVREYLAISGSEGEEEVSLAEYVEGFGQWAVIQYRAHERLPAPEMYDHSWLNLGELKEALAHRGLDVGNLAPDFRAVLVAMQSLVADYGLEKVRFVYGFGM